MISVVIPLYNKEQSILRTISSVLNQTFNDFEIIVVDDGSTDGSLMLVQGIDDPRLKIISQSNGGVSSARNKGIINAGNNLIAFIDADDLWFPNHLEIIKSLVDNFSQNDNVGGYSTKFFRSNNLEGHCGRNDVAPPGIIENYCKEVRERDKIISSSNFVARKDYLIETGMYNENYSYGEDVDLWFRLFRRYKLVESNQFTALYYTGAENRSDKKIIPLHKRFHLFQYSDANGYEKRYFDKLVSIIIIDYFMSGGYKVCLYIFWKYKNRALGVLNYFARLIKKKAFYILKIK